VTSFADPGSDEGEERAMNCVKCEGKLHQVEVDEVIVDQCDVCSGIWFDSGELSRVLGMKSAEMLAGLAEPSRADDAKRAKCPRCRGEGKLVQVASMTRDIHIDTCSVCGGQWLDGGELSILRQKGGLRGLVAFFKKLVP
jgi:Zn-finger nucleic acid-binding protein